MNDKWIPWLAVILMALFVWNLLEEWQKMVLAFVVCGTALGVSIYFINKSNTIDLKSLAGIVVGLLSTIGLLRILVYFMTTFTWVLITVAAILFILEAGFVIVIAVKVGRLVYSLLKKT